MVVRRAAQWAHIAVLAALAGAALSLPSLGFTEKTRLLTRGYTEAEARRLFLKGRLRGRLRRLLHC